ncbi:crotonobetainyl-CoA:carnitine CoA-transferase CaiB-like acyl-CoA transferase [Microbacterium resistens]|uniref:Crotonobetainyl-CoA:carnitine CoA-transferase CaiB-like acyl-CoA transferase n=1 Tax=Microbacterium resistens TaxID=156977 RepID=A0ABU1S819_9MICO|nr:CoA transferase [Microbacterium resistens]MDR6865767.1 crotonobetainyl-CoA:carnitine CoA-transferase CaiB-like acyl-CoA transferase [Microbacterium resistens]
MNLGTHTSSSPTQEPIEALKVMNDVLELVDPALRDFQGFDPRHAVVLTGCDPVTPSVHHIGDAALGAIGAYGVELAAFSRARSAELPHARIDIHDAVAQLMAPFFTRVGQTPIAEVADDPRLMENTGFYATKDGGWILLVLSYPHLRDRVCQVLDCPPEKSRIVAAVAQWDGLELEEAIAAARGSATVVRSQEQWRQSPPGRALVGRPVVSVERIGDAPPRPLPPISGPTSAPMVDVRVVDNTHVIAGPVAGRLFADAGAEVLHVSRPDRPDSNQMLLETGRGKRNAYCDVRDPEQAERLWEILAEANVYLCNYNNLDAKGLGATEMALRCPGIVIADVHGWGVHGPWKARGGFDQVACSATGFALEEGGDHPALPPTHLLNDYLASYLLSAGTIAALRRQSTEGGSWQVHVDLAAISMWVQDLGLFERADVEDLPHPLQGMNAVATFTNHGPFGEVSSLVPPITGTPESGIGPQPLGSSVLGWSTDVTDMDSSRSGFTSS